MEVSGGVSLPEDVIFAVLSWLPVKPLCRFRCVSKGWRTLISSPAFITAQRSHAAPLLVGVFVAPASSDKLDLQVMDTDGNVLRVLSGVLRSYDYGRLLPTRLDVICVDNLGNGASVIDPATRAAIAVGRQCRRHDDVRRARQTNVFGRAAASGAYKVLRLYERLLGVWPERVVLGPLCDVATLGGDTEPAWRQRPAPPFYTCWCATCTATVNGVIYFLPSGACCKYLARPDVASFDLEREEWKETIHGPELRWPKPWERWSVALGELKGTVCFVQTVRSGLHGPYTDVNIWLLADPERSLWIKEYKVYSTSSLFSVKPLEVLFDGRLLLLKTIDEVYGASYSYTHILQLYDPSGTYGGFHGRKADV
ncbi:unnamed protein product [Urochloa decumbens]|uniref:F-box domain-containing protein n=1 Tax=Urochloa decumbens TaxID=240449 RepID=A0ABC9E1R9_9POAL